MTAALLHDVVDDTPVALEDVVARFGKRIAGIVAQVSQLSNTNQLLRRQRRKQARARPPPRADLGSGLGLGLEGRPKSDLNAYVRQQRQRARTQSFPRAECSRQVCGPHTRSAPQSAVC